MELRKESVQMLHVKSRATSQVTFDADYNVPDAKPDMGRLIQSKGDIVMDEVRLSEGKAFISGNLNADVLYVGEEDQKVCSLAAKLPFDETLNLEGIAGGDKMCLKWEIEDLSVHMIHSRKLNIKAIVTFYAVVDEMTGIQLPVEISEDGISVKKKKVQLMSLMVHKKDTLRIKDEVTLASNKPNIDMLLWNTIEVRGLDLRLEDNMIKARGELAVFVLYSGEDEENPLQWAEYVLPFNTELDCTGCTADMIPNIAASVMHQSIEVKPDADGEERVLSVDVVLELDMKLYREEEHDLVLDVYSPLKECILQGKEECLESLLVRNDSKCRVSDRIELKESQGKILQICHSSARIQIERTEPADNGIQIEGVLHISFLYVKADDTIPFDTWQGMIPFSYLLEGNEASADMVYGLTSAVEQLSIGLLGSDEIEIKAVLAFNSFLKKPVRIMNIEEVEFAPIDMEEVERRPGITGYIVREGDALWDLAKRYSTTVEGIMEVNGLEKDEIKPGDKILIFKENMSIL